jgi:hypothetical protein
MMKKLTWVMLFALAGLSQTPADAAPSSRYVINGDEVYDTVTDLTWKRCSVGQTWKDGAQCAGPVRVFSFDQAQRLADGDWRVPTKDELASLIDPGRQDFPTIDAEAFPDMNENRPTYWSSTPSNAERSWDVRFTVGNITDDVNAYPFAVRLVRSGK